MENGLAQLAGLAGLDGLTQDEVRMAVAQGLKAPYAVQSRSSSNSPI